MTEMVKRCTPSHTDVIFVVMDALVRICQCHEKCDYHKSDDLDAVSSRAWSELSLSAECQSVRSRVSSDRHSRQAEDEDEVVQVQDDCCHLVKSHSSCLFFRVFCFLVSSILSSLAFNFAGDLPQKFLKGASRMVTRIGKCQDRSVGRIQRSLFWSSKTRPG